MVVADAADVEDRRGREDVLGAASGVLGRAAGDELRVVVLDQVFVEAHVFFLGEDGVVGLEAVFLEHGFIAGRGRTVVSGSEVGMDEVGEISWFNGLPFALDVC